MTDDLVQSLSIAESLKSVQKNTALISDSLELIETFTKRIDNTQLFPLLAMSKFFASERDHGRYEALEQQRCELKTSFERWKRDTENSMDVVKNDNGDIDRSSNCLAIHLTHFKLSADETALEGHLDTEISRLKILEGDTNERVKVTTAAISKFQTVPSILPPTEAGIESLISELQTIFQETWPGKDADVKPAERDLRDDSSAGNPTWEVSYRSGMKIGLRKHKRASTTRGEFLGGVDVCP